MTYAQFLLTFVVVPIAVLAFAVHRRIGVWWLRGLPVVIALAIAYTGPWDHFIISEGVWGYPPGRVWGPTIGLVPLEEYGFFVLQTTFTSLVLLFFLPERKGSTNPALRHPSARPLGRSNAEPPNARRRGPLANPSPVATGEGLARRTT